MTDAEKNELKRQLYEQTTMMLVERGTLYSSVAQNALNEMYRAIDNGTYKTQAEIKLDNVHIILQALKGRKAGTIPDIVADAIQLMIEIIEKENEDNA